MSPVCCSETHGSASHNNEFSTACTDNITLIRKVRPVLKKNEIYFQFQATIVKDSVW